MIVLENIVFSTFDTECNLDAVTINVISSCITCNNKTSIVNISKVKLQDTPKKISFCSAFQVTGISIIEIDWLLNSLMIGSGVVVGTDFYDNSYKLLTNSNSRSTKCCVKDVDNSTITYWNKVYIIQQRDLLELLIFLG